MRRRLPCPLLLLVIAVCSAASLFAQEHAHPLAASGATTHTAWVPNYARLPLSFEANQGQANGDVKFLSRGMGYSLFLTANQAVLALPSREKNPLPSSIREKSQASGSPNMPGQRKSAAPGVLQMTLLGANTAARVEGLDELPGKSNYFIGNDPKKWRTNVPTYAKVKYQGVYPGIDLVYYGNQDGHLEYDFIVAPGTDPKTIAFLIGAKANGDPARQGLPVSLDSSGDIVLHQRAGGIRFQKPVVYQEDARGDREYREGRYVLAGGQTGEQPPTVSFAVGDYDHSRPLIIDPAIAYSTYLAGTTAQTGSKGSSIAVFTDPATGHVYAYVAGATCDSDFPTVNAYQSGFGGGSPDFGVCDAFVTKFDPSASGTASVIYSTYLGGTGDDWAQGIAVDSSGAAYITGNTSSSANFPKMNEFQSTNPGGGAFLTKLSADGSSLLYSTYFGGSGAEEGRAIALDSTGHAYIAGQTASSDLPTLNPYQAQPASGSSSGKAFIAGFDTTQSGPASLVYSTYLTGSYPTGSRCLVYGDDAQAIAVDMAGMVHVAGSTESGNFPIKNGYLSAPAGGCGGGFYARLNLSLQGPAQLAYSTYLGGQPKGIAVDSASNAYLSVYGGANLFVTKINPTLTGSASLTYSSSFPTEGYGVDNSLTRIAVDANGNAFVAGTAGAQLPLVNPVMGSANGVMQSLNAGQSWTLLGQGLTEFPISALAVDASTSPRTLYAASLGGDTGNYRAGIFRSTDGGLNWTKVFQMPDASPPNDLCAPNVPLAPCIFALAVDPTTPSNIYAGTSAGVMKSSDRGLTWSAFNAGLSSIALQRVTVLSFDEGTLYAGAEDGNLFRLRPEASSWTTVANSTYGVRRILVDPTTNPHTLYTDYAKSTDGGDTWISNPAIGLPWVYLGLDTSTAPATEYACDSADGDMVKSTDGGNTWVGVPWPLMDSEPGTLVVDTSTTPPTLYMAGGGQEASARRDGIIVKSIDHGITWSVVMPKIIGTIALAPTTAGPSMPATVYTSTWNPSANAFVLELNPSGALLFSTYLGGVGTQVHASGIALDAANNVYVTGSLYQSVVLNTFPAVNAFQSTAGFNSAFFTKLGSQLLPATSSEPVTTQVGVQTGTLTIEFPNITGSTSGTEPTLSVNPLSSATTANFSLSNNLGAYDISTTASFSGPVTLCIQAMTVNDAGTFNSLTLLHIVDGVAQDITTSRDFPSRTICGTTASFSPFVLVKGAVGQLQDIVRYVNESDIKKGIQTSLDAKLDNAANAFSSAAGHDYSSVCNLMNSFMNNVQAQTGKALTTAEAAFLIQAARQVKATVGCP